LVYTALVGIDPRERVRTLLRTYGRNTCSSQALDLGLELWFDDDTEGGACVAYADTGSAWIAAGDPIGPDDQADEVASRFCAAASRAGKRPRFFAIERAPTSPELDGTHIGSQPVWNPQGWAEILASKRSLREQLRRARAKGVAIRELKPGELASNLELRSAVSKVTQRWRGSRSLAPMGFLVDIELEGAHPDRRYFIAERNGGAVGVLIALPVFARNGWFIEHALRDPDAPNGTVELLFDAAMSSFADAGMEYATFGLAPLKDVQSKSLRWIRDHSRWFYDFSGLSRFKAKLEPHGWTPVYLAYPAGERGLSAVVDSLRAFARGSFARFLWATLAHRARIVVFLLATLLVPWTVILAIAPARYFPSSDIQLAWVLYDLVLITALALLLVTWRRHLAAAIASLALVDFVLGVVQLCLHNVGELDGIVDVLATTAAIAAPLFAAVFLFAARRRY